MPATEQTSLTAEQMHTPTPWYFEADVGIKGHFTIWADVGGVKTFVADCYEGPADAAFIVRAVNSFDELVAALRAVLAQRRTDDKSIVYTPAVVALVSAAIAKATRA